jgi:hypothetical protein
MKEEQDYIRDISEIRTMMERSSRFLSLSGWAGVMAGIYALAGACIAHSFFNFTPDEIMPGSLPPDFLKLIILAIIILALAIGTAIFLSWKKAERKGEKVWNATSRRLLSTMAVPLITGGIFILILIANGMTGLIAPITLIFYGLALYSAGNFTYADVKSLGVIQIMLGLISACAIEYSLLCWATGFGIVHIVYGVYMHYRYER